MGDLIRVRRRRSWVCGTVEMCPDTKCTRHLLPEWDVEIPGYRAGPGEYRPPLRISFTNHADALGWACIITDSARATGQVFALVLGGIR